MVYHANTTTDRGDFFVFGGWIDGQAARTIYRLGLVGTNWFKGSFKTSYLKFVNLNCFETFFKVGDLQHPKDSHGVIFVGSSFLVIGGDGDSGDDSEKCSFEPGLVDSAVQLRCVNQAPNLYKYYNYPELFLVDDDFGKDISKC